MRAFSSLTLSDRRDRALLRYRDSLALRVPRRMIAIGGYDRALALSAQAFVALIPMVIVIAAVIPIQGPGGRALLAGFGLSGQAAASVSVLLDHPPGVESLTVISVILLVVSVLGFIRSLQRTYLTAWELPGQGVRGLANGLLASAALIGEFALLTLFGPVLSLFIGNVPIRLTVQALAATALWWPVQYLLLGGRIRWRALLPGAALTGAGQAGAIVISGLYLPIAVDREAARYGLVGVAIALLSWLVVLGLLLVVSAVLSAELTRGPATTKDATGDARPA